MPTDPSAETSHGDRPEAAAAADLVFASQNLGREGGSWAAAGDHHVFEISPDPGEQSGSSQTDGLPIRESNDGAVTAPVDVPAVVRGGETGPVGPASTARTSGFRVLSTSSPALVPREGQMLWTVRALAPAAHPSQRGWNVRETRVRPPSAHATMLRLREEAVTLSWKAAWITVTAADSRLFKRRDW